MTKFKEGQVVRYTGGLYCMARVCRNVDLFVMLINKWPDGMWGVHCVHGGFKYLQCNEEYFNLTY